MTGKHWLFQEIQMFHTTPTFPLCWQNLTHQEICCGIKWCHAINMSLTPCGWRSEETTFISQVHPDVSWDDFNDAYGRFSSAKDRVTACVDALKNESGEFKSKVLESMLKIADASKENDNETNVSPEEMDFIQQIREALE